MPPKNVDGLSRVLDNLDRHGNMNTWKFGTQILKKLNQVNKIDDKHISYKLTRFPLIEGDNEVRLHIIDLAINKYCVFIERNVEHDYCDIIFIHENIIPLWHLFYTSSNRLENFNPFFLNEFFERKLRFKRFDFNNINHNLSENLSGEEIKQKLNNIIEETRDTLDMVRKNVLLREHAGEIIMSGDTLITRPDMSPSDLNFIQLSDEPELVTEDT